MESNAAFALVCASGMMDCRDWFIAACTTDKKLMQIYEQRKTASSITYTKFLWQKNDLSEFYKLKDQFYLVDVSDHGVVYDYPENPLKIAALSTKSMFVRIDYPGSKKKMESPCPTDALFNEIEGLSIKIKRLHNKLNQGW